MGAVGRAPLTSRRIYVNSRIIYRIARKEMLDRRRGDVKCYGRSMPQGSIG